MKKKKEKDKLLKREKTEITLIIILAVLLILIYSIVKILLLQENKYYMDYYEGISIFSDAEYNSNGEKLNFINCNDCNYIKVQDLQIPDNIEGYKLESDINDMNDDDFILRYVNDENELMGIFITIIDISTRQKTKVYNAYSDIRTIKGLKTTNAYYDVYKYILTFQQKKLKANIFDFNRTIEEKNDILHLNVFIEKDIESIILHNYGKVKEIIEINSKTYSDKSISKTYSFILNNKEYKIAFAMIKNPNNANKSYINYLKLDSISDEIKEEMKYYLFEENGINDPKHREKLESLLNGVMIERHESLLEYLNKLEGELDTKKDISQLGEPLPVPSLEEPISNKKTKSRVLSLFKKI